MIRRMLAFAAISLGVAQLASASFVISFSGSCSPGVGTCFVTQTHTLPSAQLNITSPQALLSFYNFNDPALGIAAGASLSGVTFDSVFDNVLSALSVTNNDTNTADPSSTVQVTLLSKPGLDTNSTLNAADIGKIMNGINISPLSDGLNLGTGGGTLFTLADTGFQTLSSGASYNYAGLPGVALRTGNSFNFGHSFGPCNTINQPVDVGSPSTGVCQGTTNPSLGTNPVTLTTANYGGTGSYTWGLVDTVSYAVAASGNSGTTTIQVSYTTSYDLTAEVTYAYTLPSNTPEPATMALFGSALVGLGLLRRRTSRK